MSKPNSLCSADHLAKTALFAEWAPAALKGFQALAGGAFAAGALSVQDKEIIAFACAHVLRCPYCIDYHHGLATQAGATRNELTEAVWVAIAMAAQAPLAHAAIALRLLDGASAATSTPATHPVRSRPCAPRRQRHWTAIRRCSPRPSRPAP